jgi:hypothetical protein
MQDDDDSDSAISSSPSIANTFERYSTIGHNSAMLEDDAISDSASTPNIANALKRFTILGLKHYISR